MRTFCEEVVRLEGPVQGLFRMASKDIELHGVTIPAGAMINVRYAAANRDEREFECPEQIDLERNKPGRHLGYGSGIHHCLGAPLARPGTLLGIPGAVRPGGGPAFCRRDEFVRSGAEFFTARAQRTAHRIRCQT